MIELDNVSISYGKTEVVKPLSLEIARGEFFTLLGPSGCGKTTILRAIAGFVPVARGRIRLGGNDITDVSAENRDVGIVFQNYALFPHMTVEDNVAFGLRVAKKQKTEITEAVDRILDATGISIHRAKKPAALSGGQQQRVAIARSLVMGTQVLLFDEPLSNLDTKIREDMRREIKALQRDLDFTAVFVTHDQEDALSMSDRLLVFNEGRVEQVGTARELYESPSTPFVCKFVGNANKIGPRTLDALGFPDRDQVFVRPEHIKLFTADGPDLLSATIVEVDYVGPTTRIYVNVLGEALSVHAFNSSTIAGLATGQQVKIGVDLNSLHKFGD